jgi:hypothetical protein
VGVGVGREVDCVGVGVAGAEVVAVCDGDGLALAGDVDGAVAGGWPVVTGAVAVGNTLAGRPALAVAPGAVGATGRAGDPRPAAGPGGVE